MTHHLTRDIRIFDTTLRDGEQAPGYSLTVDQKLAIAESSERLGVNIIETGFPASSPADFEATRQICRSLHRATPCGFARSVREDIDACAQAMADASNPQIQLASVGSDIHMKYKRRITRDQAIKEAVTAIDYAKQIGFTDISLAVEDATRSDITFLKTLIGRGIERGATSVAIPDTVGCCLPGEFSQLIREIRAFVGDDIHISIHCHDDLGLAVANSIAGIEAGGDEVQVTYCGIGERAGNTSMEELVAVLSSKEHVLNCRIGIVRHRLSEVCAQVAEFIGLNIPLHKSIIGRNAFATEAGMHQQGVLQHRFTYEFLRAEDFGAESRTMIGRHSGRNILRQRLRAAGIKELNQKALDQVYEMIIREPHIERYNNVVLLQEKYQTILNSTQSDPYQINSDEPLIINGSSQSLIGGSSASSLKAHTSRG
jgi:2-isopropylmalate synthase